MIFLSNSPKTSFSRLLESSQVMASSSLLSNLNRKNLLLRLSLPSSNRNSATVVDAKIVSRCEWDEEVDKIDELCTIM